jgi:predicted transcriptional regulator
MDIDTESQVADLTEMFKVLADESRLRLLALLLHGRERGVEELAAMVGLRAPTVSHHLARLRGAGFVAMRVQGNAHYYRADRAALARASRDLLSTEHLRGLVRDVEHGGWERKVLRDFTVGATLKEIPASRRKRDVILRWLAQDFSAGRAYEEREVNEIIGRHHPDFATLRRELVGAGLLRRAAGVYEAGAG